MLAARLCLAGPCGRRGVGYAWWTSARRKRARLSVQGVSVQALSLGAGVAWAMPESIESNGVADAVKLAVCSCIEMVSQQV